MNQKEAIAKATMDLLSGKDLNSYQKPHSKKLKKLVEEDSNDSIDEILDIIFSYITEEEKEEIYNKNCRRICKDLFRH